MKPISEITSPILADLYRREAEIFNRVDSDLRRALDRNNETIRRLTNAEQAKGNDKP